jgi:hypothetical protein
MPETVTTEMGIADSVHAAANVTAPGAGVTIVTLAAASLPKGVYEIRVSAKTGVASAAADDGNVQLRAGGVPVIAALPTNGQEEVIDRLTLDGATALTLFVVGAATAAVVYTGRITATRVA